MNILLTGAFGNIGRSALEEMLRKGHSITCFDIPTKRNKVVASKYPVDVVWGDLRRDSDVAKAYESSPDVVVHLAAMIPPMSEEDPFVAKEINVDGTRRIIDNAGGADIIFASSVSVHGSGGESPKRHDSYISPTGHYARHKVTCEDMIKDSGLNYTILRFGVVPSLSLRRIDPVMFTIPLDTRMEFLHTRDAGLAIANAVTNKSARKKTLMVAGGEDCRFTFKEYIGGVLDAAGIGMLPDDAFKGEPYYTDWMDTTESQQLLTYQRFKFEDYLSELKEDLGAKRHLIRLGGPLIRAYLLKQSPHL